MDTRASSEYVIRSIDLHDIFFARFTRLNIRQYAIDNITLVYCAFAKRVQVTEKFCTKVQNSVRDELGVNITLSQAALNALYKGYMQGVNEHNAEQVLSSLNNLIPDITSRLKLTLQGCGIWFDSVCYNRESIQ